MLRIVFFSVLSFCSILSAQNAENPFMKHIGEYEVMFSECKLAQDIEPVSCPESFIEVSFDEESEQIRIKHIEENGYVSHPLPVYDYISDANGVRDAKFLGTDKTAIWVKFWHIYHDGRDYREKREIYPVEDGLIYSVSIRMVSVFGKASKIKKYYTLKRI